MAAVLDALAPYVKQLITDMAEEELRMLLGVSGEIEKLGDKLDNLEDYLADAERRRIDDSRVQGWVSKLKGALYEATDILELCQLDTERRHKGRRRGGCCFDDTKAPGCLLPLLFCLRNPSFAHRMGGRIKQLNANLDAIREEMADFSFTRLDPYQLRSAPSDATPHNRMTTSLLDEPVVVGDAIKADTKTLVHELLTNEPAIKVVSITGAGGMGKSTLAKNIFNDKDIQEGFRTKIWLSITESYNAEKLLSSAITQADGGHDLRGDQQVLTRTLAAALSSAGRFLLLLDDVWTNRSWSDVLRSPVLEAGRRQPGSRVIITTRDTHLVKDMGAAYYPHHVKPLHDEDAWCLLKKQLLPQVHASLRTYSTTSFFSRINDI